MGPPLERASPAGRSRVLCTDASAGALTTSRPTPQRRWHGEVSSGSGAVVPGRHARVARAPPRSPAAKYARLQAPPHPRLLAAEPARDIKQRSQHRRALAAGAPSRAARPPLPRLPCWRVPSPSGRMRSSSVRRRPTIHGQHAAGRGAARAAACARAASRPSSARAGRAQAPRSQQRRRNTDPVCPPKRARRGPARLTGGAGSRRARRPSPPPRAAQRAPQHSPARRRARWRLAARPSRTPRPAGRANPGAAPQPQTLRCFRSPARTPAPASDTLALARPARHHCLRRSMPCRHAHGPAPPGAPTKHAASTCTSVARRSVPTVWFQCMFPAVRCLLALLRDAAQVQPRCTLGVPDGQS